MIKLAVVLLLLPGVLCAQLVTPPSGGGSPQWTDDGTDAIGTAPATDGDIKFLPLNPNGTPIRFIMAAESGLQVLQIGHTGTFGITGGGRFDVCTDGQVEDCRTNIARRAQFTSVQFRTFYGGSAALPALTDNTAPTYGIFWDATAMRITAGGSEVASFEAAKVCNSAGDSKICDYGLLATAPGSCAVGDTYMDSTTSPHGCVCSTLNTWTLAWGAGSCA